MMVIVGGPLDRRDVPDDKADFLRCTANWLRREVFNEPIRSDDPTNGYTRRSVNRSCGRRDDEDTQSVHLVHGD